MYFLHQKSSELLKSQYLISKYNYNYDVSKDFNVSFAYIWRTKGESHFLYKVTEIYDVNHHFLLFYSIFINFDSKK